MDRLVRLILRYKKAVLTVIFACTAASVFLLPQLRFNSEYINLLPPKPEHTLLARDVLSVTDKSPKDLYCLFEGDAVFSSEALNALKAVIADLKTMQELKDPLSAFSFITFQKKGTRLVSLPLSPLKESELFTDQSALVFRQRLMADRIAQGLLSTEDGNGLLMQISLEVEDSYSKEIAQSIEKKLEPLKAYGEVSFVGTLLFEDHVLEYLSHDLAWLLSLCLSAIVLMFYLAFRSKRAVIIPFSLSLIALLWTLAIMVLLDYELTVVNVIVPSMVLILGSSYAIHVLNEYYLTIQKERTDEQKEEQIVKAVTTISKTIFGACTTTVVGFLSLVMCELEAFQELGLSVSVGITLCAVLSLLYIPSMLALLPYPKQKQVDGFSHGMMAHLVHAFSLISVRMWKAAIALLLLLSLCFLLVKDEVKLETDYLAYFPRHDELIQKSIDFAKKIGGSDPHYITLTAPKEEKEYFLQPEVLQQVFAFEEYLIKTNDDITHLFSFPRYAAFLHEVYQGSYNIPQTPGLTLMLFRLLKVAAGQLEAPLLSSLIRDDGARMTITVRSYDSRYQSWESLGSVQNLQASIEEAKQYLPGDVLVDDWGVGVDALRMSRTIKDDQDRSLRISLLFVFLLVLLQFRSLRMGLLALIPTLTGIMGNYVFMYLLAIPFDVVTVIFASITVGVGVDAAIHFLIRFRRRESEHPTLAYAVLLTRTLEETARPILLSSISLIVGLLMLLFASFIPVKYFGLLLSFALLVTTIATLIILPALMMALHQVQQKLRSKDRS